LSALAGNVLTRDVIEVQIERPVEAMLDSLLQKGTILGYELSADKNSHKRAAGMVDLKLTLALDELAQPVTLELRASGFRPEPRIDPLAV
jgi:hypothetical protein